MGQQRGTTMASYHVVALPVGMQVRMKELGRTGTVREVLAMPSGAVYYVVQDTSPEEAVTVTGAPAAEFGMYCTADAFDVLPS